MFWSVECCHVTNLQDLKKVSLEVQIVKIRKQLKIFNKLNNDKFYPNLAKNRDTNIFSTISLSPETIQYL